MWEGTCCLRTLLLIGLDYETEAAAAWTADQMGVCELFLQASTSAPLLGGLLLLLLLYLSSSVTFSSDKDRKCPPRPLPILVNLLQLDLNRPFNNLMEVRGHVPVHP